MSFSSEVKDELARVNPEAPAVRRAELSALLLYGGKWRAEEEQLLFSSEHAGRMPSGRSSSRERGRKPRNRRNALS